MTWGIIKDKRALNAGFLGFTDSFQTALYYPSSPQHHWQQILFLNLQPYPQDTFQRKGHSE